MKCRVHIAEVTKTFKHICLWPKCRSTKQSVKTQIKTNRRPKETSRTVCLRLLELGYQKVRVRFQMGLQRHKRAAILMLSGCWFHKGPSPLVWCEKRCHQQIWEIRRLNINKEGQWLKPRLVWQEYRCSNWMFNKRGMCFLTFGNVLFRGFCFIFLYCDIIE